MANLGSEPKRSQRAKEKAQKVVARKAVNLVVKVARAMVVRAVGNPEASQKVAKARVSMAPATHAVSTVIVPKTARI